MTTTILREFFQTREYLVWLIRKWGWEKMSGWRCAGKATKILHLVLFSRSSLRTILRVAGWHVAHMLNLCTHSLIGITSTEDRKIKIIWIQFGKMNYLADIWKQSYRRINWSAQSHQIRCRSAQSTRSMSNQSSQYPPRPGTSEASPPEYPWPGWAILWPA